MSVRVAAVLARCLTRDRVAAVAAVAAPLAAAGILLPFRAAWSNTNVALLLVVVVVAVAAIGSRVAGAVAAVSAAAWFDFFFTLPYYRFTIRRFIGHHDRGAAAGGRRGGVAARCPGPEAEGHRDHRRGLSGADPRDRVLAQSARSADAVVNHVRDQLTGVLGLAACRFEYGSLLGHPPRLEPDGTVMNGHIRWDVEQFGLPGEEVELRTFGNGLYYGRFMMKPDPAFRPSLQARLVAVTLADLAGRALYAGETAGFVRH